MMICLTGAKEVFRVLNFLGQLEKRHYDAKVGAGKLRSKALTCFRDGNGLYAVYPSSYSFVFW